jgi:hypothetical protein
MPCEKYQDALTDLAAQSAKPSADVCAHLAGCVSCRSYIEQEQFLLASIDGALRSSVNAALPAALVQRLEARFAQESSRQHRTVAVWTLAGVGIAVLASVLLLIQRPFGLLRSHGKSGLTVVNSIKESAFPDVPSPLARTPNSPAVSVAPNTMHRRYPRAAAKISAGDDREPEVLVPSDEREALARFVNGLGGQPEVAGALLVRAPERTESSFPLPLIQIARLEIPPLERSDEQDTATSEK